jgi:CRISPR-associated endoribonuclease Cas6
MPSRITVTVEGGSPDRVRPHHVYGLVVGWVEPFVSGGAHTASVKPYTVTPLFRDFGGELRFAIGILDDSLVDMVEKEAARTDRIRLGSQIFDVGGVEMVSEPWGDLVGNASPGGQYGFDFLTPVVFRSQNDSNPLPAPGLVFGHLRSRWQRYAPPELGVALDLRGCDLLVTHMNARTVNVRHRHADFVGLVGDVRYRARRASASERKMLHALGRLARYAGVGSFTTNGFGVTEFTLTEAGDRTRSQPRA